MILGYIKNKGKKFMAVAYHVRVRPREGIK